VSASVIYGTAVGGFMFGFVRLFAKRFMTSSETTPPKIAGTPSSLATIRGAEIGSLGTPPSRAREICMTNLRGVFRGKLLLSPCVAYESESLHCVRSNCMSRERREARVVRGDTPEQRSDGDE
jgi:hypothetical protein